MELLILKNGALFARATSDEDGEYSLVIVEDSEVPAYPTENPAKGTFWDLEYNDGALQWVEKERPLTTEEKLENLQQEVETIKYEWKAGEAVVIGDRRYYNGDWYECLQGHTTQSDWTPDAAVSLWKVC